MTVLLSEPRVQYFDANGDPLSLGKLFFYEAGTSTKVNTYSNAGLTLANTNPITLGSDGRPEVDIFLAADDYKIVLTSSTDTDPPASPIWTVDNYSVVSPASFTASEAVNAQTGTSYTIQTTDSTKLLTLSNSNSIAVTLPQADSANFPNGWYCDVYNKGAGTATITPATSTIDGAATYTLRTGETVRIVSDGTNYQLGAIGGRNPGVNAQTGTTYTVLTGDRDKLVTFSNTATVAVTLPQANSTTFRNGWGFEAENIGAGVVTITPTTSTINGGEATLVLTRGQRAKITSDGTNYQSVTYGEPVGAEMTGYSATPPQGWLVQNGDTVGSASSGATKAAAKYQALYHYLWANVSDSYAAVSTGRGASAVADFAANKTIALPTMADKSAYGVGTAATGETAGAATVAAAGTNNTGTTGATTLSTSEIPAHTHSVAGENTATTGTFAFQGAVNAGAAFSVNSGSSGSGGSHTHTTPAPTFTGSPTSVLHPVRGKYFYIKY